MRCPFQLITFIYANLLGFLSANCVSILIISFSSSSVKASVEEMEANAEIESDNENYTDNSLALVPMSLPASTKKSELKIVNRSVLEVLDALRHAREQIQSSMESRHMIRVGPS